MALTSEVEEQRHTSWRWQEREGEWPNGAWPVVLRHPRSSDGRAVAHLRWAWMDWMEGCSFGLLGLGIPNCFVPQYFVLYCTKSRYVFALTGWRSPRYC